MKEIIGRIQINAPFRMLWDQYLDKFLENGFNPEIGIDAVALERFSMADFKSVARKFHDTGRSITLHAPFWDLSFGSPDPQIRKVSRKRLEQTLSVISIFKPKHVVCHPGYDSKRYHPIRDEWIERSLDIWRWFADAISARGALLMMENVYDHGPEELAALISSLQDLNVGWCLDTGHQNAFSRTDLSRWMKTLSPFLGQIHLHDNNGDNDEHLCPGKGTFDFELLFSEVKRLGKIPVITIEPHTEKDLWETLAYLKDSMILNLE